MLGYNGRQYRVACSLVKVTANDDAATGQHAGCTAVVTGLLPLPLPAPTLLPASCGTLERLDIEEVVQFAAGDRAP